MKGRNLPRMDPILIVCAVDARYACPLAVLLQSVLAHLPAGRTVEFHVIDGGLGPELKARIAEVLDPARSVLHWLAPQRSGFVGLPLWGRMTIAAYDKLTVPQLLPAPVGRALWLDADILALGNVAELWDRDLGDHPLLAVQDSLVPHVSSAFGVCGHREAASDPGAAYFNSGVMLMNLTVWRRDHVTERALQYLQRYHDGVYFWDQEALNAVLAGCWGPLESKWNWSPGRDSPVTPQGPETPEPAGCEGSSEPGRIRKPALPALLHFSGNLKPWRYPGRTPWHTLYYDHLDHTPWRGWRPEGRPGRWAAWYEVSRFRGALRWLEPWGMRLWRRLTRRRATARDVAAESPANGSATRAGNPSPRCPNPSSPP